ncbi:TonB family protein [Hydrocarboniclastica marina]|uniref:TonB family protein n=1 Tax=Hydrocarboniclastica marina TaxID=2259620 RepID=UPI001562CA5D|nr:TonB family protein [Hydrocarboniclastica marina]
MLIHVITGLVLLARAPEEEPTERTVQVQLVEQGVDTDAQKSSRATAASTPPVEPLAQTVAENLPAASPVEPPAEAVAPVLTTQSEPNAQARQQPPEPQQPETQTTERRAEASEAVADRSPRPQLTKDALQQPATQPSRSAAAAPSGAPDASSPLEPEEHRQVSSQPDLPQMDPYQLILSRHMMRPIKQFLQRESTLKQFNQAVEAGTQPITIELKLLANGAVRRVQLKESSGSEFVDRIAVQSALAASPYPPPPEEERPNGFRFRLHLIMSPVYL